jgi:hypothetical protein
MTDATGLGHVAIVIEPLVSASACPTPAPGRNVPSEKTLPMMIEDLETCFEVATFYRENPSTQLMARDALSIMRHLDSRTCTVIRAYDRDGKPMSDGKSTNIVAAAMCHEYLLPVTEPGSERSVVRKHFEFGSVRVRLSGFGLLSGMQSIRVLDMLLRRADCTIPFACVYEENRAVIRSLVAKRHFAEVAMPSREMLTLRAEQLRHAEGGQRPFVFLKPTMATFLGSADDVCGLLNNPLLDRQGSARDSFASVARIEIAFSQLYSPEVFEAARKISKTCPETLEDLGRLLHDDPGHFPDYFVA